MTLRENCVIALLLGVLFLGKASSTSAQSAQPAADGAAINVTADKLSAENGGTKIEASGNVEIKRDLATIRADEVRVDRQTQDVEAKGRVSFDDPDWQIKSADSLQLNLGKEIGEIENGNLFIEQGHISIMGRRFQKLGGQVYHVDDGFFTTCLCESGAPPWKFSADQMDLSANGLAIIKDGYFYVLDVPVFYLPYGFFPLKSERQTGFLFPKFGSSTTEGYRFQQPFFWAISKSTDATLTFNIETRARVGAIGELRTMFDQNSDFRYHSAFFNETFRNRADESIVDPFIADPRIPQNRWGVLATHRYLTAADWLTYSDTAAYRDTLFTRELIDRFDLPATKEGDIRRSRFGESRMGIFRAWGDTFLRGEWKFYQDFIQPAAMTLQRTPQVAFWGQRFLSGFPLEFRWRTEAVNYLRRKGGDGLRFDLRPEAVLPFKMSHLFGAVSVAPRQTLYHLYTPVKSSERNLARPLVEMRGNVATSMSRVFAWNGTSGAAIKHVIEPQLSYLFVPGVDQSNIPIMDNIDRIRRRNVLTFAVANRFWGRPVRSLAAPADEKDTELVSPLGPTGVLELGQLRLALSYDIDKERNGGDNLSDLDIYIRLIPLSYVYMAFEGGIHPGPWQISQARTVFAISDPRLRRPSLDPDFNRPNSVGVVLQFLRNSQLGFLSEDANANLDEPATPAYCAKNSPDPRCAGFHQNIIGSVGTNAIYHATNNILLYLSSSYDVLQHRFLGVRGATKYLSTCECWSITFRVGYDINPAKTSFSFDFNLLGVGTAQSTLR